MGSVVAIEVRGLPGLLWAAHRVEEDWTEKVVDVEMLGGVPRLRPQVSIAEEFWCWDR